MTVTNASKQLARAESPHCFQAGGIMVRVSFRPGGEALEEKLKRYFLALKQFPGPARRDEGLR